MNPLGSICRTRRIKRYGRLIAEAAVANRQRWCSGPVKRGLWCLCDYRFPDIAGKLEVGQELSGNERLDLGNFRLVQRLIVGLIVRLAEGRLLGIHAVTSSHHPMLDRRRRFRTCGIHTRARVGRYCKLHEQYAEERHERGH